MNLLRFSLLVATGCVAVTQAAEPAKGIGGFSGTLTLSTGGALLDGDRARYQQDSGERKSGFVGIEELTLSRDVKDGTLTITGKALHGNEDYALRFKWLSEEKGYIDVGAESFRVFYDATAGYFPPTDLKLEIYDDALHLDRSRIWVAAGITRPNLPYFNFRYEHITRDGLKGSTAWGDTNLVGTAFGTRNIVPTFWDLDETRDVFTADLGQETENQSWNVGARYERSELNNRRVSRRRPLESADRTVVTKDTQKTDLFSLHGYIQRQLNEHTTFSTGALVTRLDTDLGGSRIYGQSYDPIYDPVYLRRQARDEGFYHLTGGAELRQYVANINLDYRPKEHWQIRPALRFERTRTENTSEFLETTVATNLTATQEEAEGESKREWKEASESLEVRYTGRPDLTLSLRGEWLQGTGNLDEFRVLDTGAVGIDRDTELERRTHKYAATANWYARPGLTFAAQYYFKLRENDFDTTRDNTPNTLTSGDRYPGYITDQDFQTHDMNVRVTWRATTWLSLTSRYDYQRSAVRSSEAGLGAVDSSQYRSHIFSESVMLNPLPRLYLTGGLNVAYDQIYTPASTFSFIKNGDNNYTDASLGGGYAASKLDDLYLDYGHYHAHNYINNSLQTLAFGGDERRDAASITWVRRQTEHLIFTFKYTFATYRDRAVKNLNDYDAHIGHAKVQYRF